MNDKELAALKSVSGPSAALKAKADSYMRITAERKAIDAYDAANGTDIGKKLKRIFYGQPEEAPQPAPEAKAPSAVELAKDVKEFPLSRCQAIFKRDANTPGESYKDLTSEQYQSAKRAAKFLGVLPNDGSDASVKYIYSTSRDRAAARQAKEDAANAEAQRQKDFIPPGITKNEKGEILLTDAAAFDAWKKEKADHSEAIKFLEQAGGAE
jgi:dienelactone hydrolase